MSSLPSKTINLRDGFRVEVQRTLMPAGKFAAQLYEKRHGVDRTTFKKIGPLVVADFPEDAARDLLAALNDGTLPGVEGQS